MKCPTCKGTGTAPDKTTLECVGCQAKVNVTYSTPGELIELCATVKCAECKRAIKP